MNDRPNQPEPGGPAPADARPRGPWPLWKRVLAYVILSALALASIWYIDLKAHQSVQERGHSSVGPGLAESTART